MTTRNDQAIVAGDVTNDSRYTSLLKRRHDDLAQPVADGRADRQRQEREHGQLAKQDQRDLAARESQHAQARQLALPLGQRDARRVVDDAERDDRRRTSR